MALIGNLENFKFVQLLQVIDHGRKTGRLTIQNRGQSAQLYFEDGRLAFGAFDGQITALRDSLLKSGQISRELDEYVVSTYRPVTEKGLVLLLEDAGILSRDEISALESARLRSIVDLLLIWDSGSFKFEPGVSPPAEKVTVSMDLESVIVGDGKRSQDLDESSSALPDFDAVLRFSRQHDEKAGSVRLGQEEWRVIARIDGKTTVKMIAEANGLDELAARKLVHRLLSAGLVEVVENVPAGGEGKKIVADSVGEGTKKGFIHRLTGRVRKG